MHQRRYEKASNLSQSANPKSWKCAPMSPKIIKNKPCNHENFNFCGSCFLLCYLRQIKFFKPYHPDSDPKIGKNKPGNMHEQIHLCNPRYPKSCQNGPIKIGEHRSLDPKRHDRPKVRQAVQMTGSHTEMAISVPKSAKNHKSQSNEQ